MAFDVREGILTIEGEGGQRIGVGTGGGGLTMWVNVGEAGASYAGDMVGIGVWNGPPHPLIPSPRCGEGWTRQRTE